jgi:hypothetical protein
MQAEQSGSRRPSNLPSLVICNPCEGARVHFDR